MEAMCQTPRERKSKSLDKGIRWGEKEKWRKRNREKRKERAKREKREIIWPVLGLSTTREEKRER